MSFIDDFLELFSLECLLLVHYPSCVVSGEMLLQGLFHFFNELLKPVLNLVGHWDLFNFNLLTIFGKELGNLISLLASIGTRCVDEFETEDTLEHLVDVGKDWLGVLRLTNNFQKIII